MMGLPTFFARRNDEDMDPLQKEEEVEDMDSPWKGRSGQRHEPSSEKGGVG